MSYEPNYGDYCVMCLNQKDKCTCISEMVIEPIKFKLTEKQKLEALSLKFYSGLKWEPKAGDYYTTSRSDLELYQVVEVTDTLVKTKYLTPDSPISEWDKNGFTTEGFGDRRVYVPNSILNL